MWKVPATRLSPHVAYWVDEDYQTIYRRITAGNRQTYAWADMHDIIAPLNLDREPPELVTDEWHTVDRDGDLGDVSIRWIEETFPDAPPS